MAANTAKRPEYLQKMMAASPRHEPEVEDVQLTLKEARLAIPTPMFDLVLRSGEAVSFSYALLKLVRFKPGDELTLKFADGSKVTVEGRGLAHHRQQLRLHRACEIRECSESELALDEEGISQVEKISIIEVDEA